jgi:hypothetical protein
VSGALVLLALGLGLSLLGCSEPPPDQALGSTVKEQIPRWARVHNLAIFLEASKGKH